MTDLNTIGHFQEIIKESFNQELLIKISLGKTKSKITELKNVFIRPVMLHGEMLLSFTYRYLTQDKTQNHNLQEALQIIKGLLDKDFMQANLFDNSRDVQLMISKKGKITINMLKPSMPLLQTLNHDKIKKRLIEPEGRQYLQQLGVTNSNFEVIPAMSNKFRQINKFIEIINSILPEKTTPDSLKVVDMGSGKGYLTFALYDHLTNNRNIPAQITGVEMRRDLVEKCNQIAKISDFKNLTFQKSNIQEFEIENLNMLIALHACDTATDDAIYKGITAGADYIVVAPCCHKQVRKSMNVDDALKPVLRHGIFLERQAELLTDGIRSLLLEKYGYKVKTLEFISTEHTPKNVMIIAIKSDKIVDKVGISEQIYQIKKIFGIEYQHLENLLGSY